VTRRAFTILEMLVVVLVIVLIMSIVAPIAVSEIGRSSLEESKRQFEAGVTLARADAQRRGVVLRLWARPADDSRATDSFFELYTVDVYSAESAAPREENSSSNAPSPEAGLSSSSPNSEPERPDSTAVHEAPALTQTILMLPAGIRVASSLPARFSLDPGADAVTSDTLDNDPAGALRDDATDEPGFAKTLIATCLPDGRVYAGRTAYLFADKGRAWSISINSWTGRVDAQSILPREFTSRPASETPGPEPTNGGAPDEKGTR
jgi:prepilin-type N-terminal cleavage/methylation domain-containing protein